MSFSKLFTTLVLVTLTLAAPLNVANTADNAIGDVNVNSITSPVQGSTTEAKHLIGSAQDSANPVVGAAVNAANGALDTEPLPGVLGVTSSIIKTIPTAGRRELADTADPIVSALKDDSRVYVVSAKGEVQDVTNELKSKLSRRGILTGLSPDVIETLKSHGVDVSSVSVPDAGSVAGSTVDTVLTTASKRLLGQDDNDDGLLGGLTTVGGLLNGVLTPLRLGDSDLGASDI